jgi:hypothetical protein
MRLGSSEVTSAESWQRGYLSDTRDSLVGSYLYNNALTTVHYTVSGAERVKEWQVISMPLNINDFHTLGMPTSLSNEI